MQKIVKVTVLKSQETRLAGGIEGQYDYGVSLKLEDNKAVGMRLWTSADIPYCPNCGSFNEWCLRRVPHQRRKDYDRRN